MRNKLMDHSCWAVTSGGEGGWGAKAPPQFLAKQLTLSQPGGLIMPTTVLRAPSPDSQTLRRPCHVLVNSKIVIAMFVLCVL